MRAQAAMCSGRWCPGACTTSVLGLIGAARDDPQFGLRNWTTMRGWMFLGVGTLLWASSGKNQACAALCP
eukprot:3159916-Pyramimonas_sp.AAC.1